MQKIVLSIGNNERSVFIEMRDKDIFQMMEEVKGLLIAWGYHPNSVDEGFRSMVEDD